MSRILVVDDEATVRALLRDILELEGHEVDEAVDGPTALDRVEADPPDLVLLDVMMPGMSGIDVLAAIRRHEGAVGALPVAMLTAAGDDETTWAGWTNGASVYLNKPFDHLALLTWIDRLLDLTPTTPAAPAA